MNIYCLVGLACCNFQFPSIYLTHSLYSGAKFNFQICRALQTAPTTPFSIYLIKYFDCKQHSNWSGTCKITCYGHKAGKPGDMIHIAIILVQSHFYTCTSNPPAVANPNTGKLLMVNREPLKRAPNSTNRSNQPTNQSHFQLS